MSVDESVDHERTRIVNSSGFPLEKKLAHDVQEAFSQSRIQWTVSDRQRPWQSGGHDGFIDLILSAGYQRLILECKRPKYREWIFLIERKRADRVTSNVRCPWACRAAPDVTRWSGICDFEFVPDSPEADVCVVGKDNDSPLLELYARKLIESMEATAMQHCGALPTDADFSAEPRVYVPAIVTTAELVLCIHDPAKTDDLGNMRDAEYRSVPMVRFTKTLVTSSRWSHENDDGVRTVLVINAKAFIGQLRLLAHGSGNLGLRGRMPWDPAV